MHTVTANVAVGMINNGDWVKDNNKTHANKPNHHKKNDNDKKNGAVDGIVHDAENKDDTGTMEHVLAVIDSNSNVTEYHSCVEPTQEDFDDEDPGEVIGVIFPSRKRTIKPLTRMMIMNM